MVNRLTTLFLRPTPTRLAALVLALHLALWSGVNRLISPHPDYIDHWVQSRIFSFGYHEHPPLTPWLIKLLTALLGSSETGLEAAALLVNLGVIGLAWALARKIYGPLAALFTLLLLETTVYFTAGSVFLQIDQPLMLAWLGGIWALANWLESKNPRWLLLAGFIAGLGALSKYTMILFYLAWGLYLALCRPLRGEFKNPWQWAGGLMAMAAVSPVIIWNGLHDWVSFRFQLSKGATGAAVPMGKHLLEFTLGWLLLFGAVGAVWAFAAAWRHLRAKGVEPAPQALLLVMGLTPLALFSAAMLRGSFPDPKWANLSFLALYIFLGGQAARWWKEGGKKRVGGLLAGGLALNAMLLGLLAWHGATLALPIPQEGDPLRQILGWRQTVGLAGQALERHQRPLPQYVVSFFYPLASQFALHMRGQPLTYSLEREPRNLWSSPEKMTPQNSLFVCETRCDWLVERAQTSLGWHLELLEMIDNQAPGAARHRVGLYIRR